MAKFPRSSLFSLRGALLTAWGLALLVLLVLIVYPVETARLRLSVASLLALVWLGLIIICWGQRKIRFSLLGATALALGFLVLPGRESIDRAALAQNCAEAMRRYEGSPYVWGGEKPWGIDCSGLVRRGLIDALLWQGVSTLNPSLVRMGIFLWWSDTTARDMGKGGGQTVLLFETGSINSLDHTTLRPGDMAVTKSGVHILGYLVETKPGSKPTPAQERSSSPKPPPRQTFGSKAPSKSSAGIFSSDQPIPLKEDSNLRLAVFVIYGSNCLKLRVREGSF